MLLGTIGNVIVVASSDEDPQFDWWIERLHLHSNDLQVLRDGKELTCNLINAASILLKSQFPGILGLQDTVLAHNLRYRAIPMNKVSIQILHTGTVYTPVHVHTCMIYLIVAFSV